MKIFVGIVFVLIGLFIFVLAGGSDRFDKVLAQIPTDTPTPTPTPTSGPIPTDTPTPPAPTDTPTPTPTSPPIPTDTPTPTPTPIPTYNISGNVYIDANNNKIKDGEANYTAGTTVILSGSASLATTTDSLGNYAFPGLYAGTYSVTLTLPSGYKNTTPISQSITFP